MSNAMTRTHSGDRFYNPPAMRRHHQQQRQQQQQLLLQQQQVLQRQLQRPSQKENPVDPPQGEARTDSDESTLSRPNSVRSASPPPTSNLTNLDRLMESVTPFVPAQLPEARIQGRRTREADAQPFYCLRDLWESFREWSVYGVGVPLLLNGGESIKQYYVPSLSGIQLYADARRLRRHGEDADAESSRETSSAGSSDCEAEKRAKGGIDGAWGQHNLVNLNSQRLQRMALRDKPPTSSSGDETETCNRPSPLVFEYLEQEQPHHRKPLSQFLHPNSQRSISTKVVIYYHLVGCLWPGKNQAQVDAPGGRKAYGVGSSKVALPAFGLASYKLRVHKGDDIGAQVGRDSEVVFGTEILDFNTLFLFPDRLLQVA
ncbi:hypothetical protein Tsubulata_032039 [Turnera subulata]|uniref:Uncharacterized protein n=1 Tax=Turnera subulata TaxID=218843 RepID=A0A9Q0FZ28_9ROSI|nr:hypothetical protein Tsubulata_032039 [Turnera subulata]